MLTLSLACAWRRGKKPRFFLGEYEKMLLQFPNNEPLAAKHWS